MKTSQIILSKWPWFGLLLLPLVVMLALDQPAPRATLYPFQNIPLVVVAAPDDPYYPLAEEISAAEAAPLAADLKEGLSLSPQALIWVTSPGRLSYAAMVNAGQELLSAGNYPPMGIITASTVDGARSLWKRRTQAGQGRLYAVNAVYPTASIFEGRILAMDEDPPARRDLSVKSLSEALAEAGYLTFTGHGGGRTWMIDETLDFTAADLPELSAPLISAASCETFKPWGDDSLALGFADRGAALYSGYTFKPNEGNLLGEYEDLPFRYTWPGFTAGMVSRVQAEGGMQVFALQPFYFTLGDPRISLNDSPPYTLKNESRTDDEWLLEYQDAPAGVIPVVIEGGADWPFVDVQDVGDIVDGSKSYHARLQTANVNGDKYLLFVHQGGDFTLRLKRRVPLWWRVVNPMMNAFDEAYINSKINDIGSYLLAAALLAWLLVLWRRSGRPGFTFALLAGLLPALFITFWRAGYGWLRVSETMINAKPLYFEPIWYISGLLLTWAGAVLLFMPGGWRARITGIILALMLPLFPAAFWAVLFMGSNLLVFFMKDAGGMVYHLNNTLFELTAAAFELPMLAGLFSLTTRMLGISDRQ